MHVPPPVERRVLQALLDHPDLPPVDGRKVEVVLRAAQMPLSAHVRLVSCRLERLRHEMLAQIDPPRIVDPHPDAVPACQKGRPRHAAHCRRIKPLQPDPPCSQSIHVRRRNRHLSGSGVVANIAPALVVGHDDHHVRRFYRVERERTGCSASGRVGHRSSKVVGANCSRRSAQNPRAAQRHPRRQGPGRECPRVARRAPGRRKALPVRRRGERILKGCRRVHTQRRQHGVTARRFQRGAGAVSVIHYHGILDQRPGRLPRNRPAVHPIPGRAVTVEPIVKKRHGHRRNPGGRLHHNVIHVDFGTGRPPGTVPSELKPHLERVHPVRIRQVIVIELKPVRRGAIGLTEAGRKIRGVPRRRELECPAQPHRGIDRCRVELHKRWVAGAGQPCGGDRVPGRCLGLCCGR